MLLHNKHIYSCKQFELQSSIDNTINTYSVKRLCSVLNIPPPAYYKFYAGTMFWCSKEYCHRIHTYVRTNPELLELFEDEPIMCDGTMAHEWERMLCNL